MPKRKKSSQVDLDRYRWRNRLVLIFAGSAEDGSYRKQMNEFKGKATGLEDRDIIVMELLGASKAAMGGPHFTDAQRSFLRTKFKVTGDTFVFVLIGKDGTVKLKSEETVSLADLFSLIDSMPMRKEEMRTKTSKLRIQ